MASHAIPLDSHGDLYVNEVALTTETLIAGLERFKSLNGTPANLRNDPVLREVFFLAGVFPIQGTLPSVLSICTGKSILRHKPP